MTKYTWKEWQKHKCEKLGHDWAFQFDMDSFITKTCLRCGFTQFYFPEETDQEFDDNEQMVDDHRSEEEY